MQKLNFMNFDILNKRHLDANLVDVLTNRWHNAVEMFYFKNKIRIFCKSGKLLIKIEVTLEQIISGATEKYI